MKVTMLLADAAEAMNGKLYILGGGWSITGPQATPSAIAIKIDVPWDLANTPHTLRLDLLNEDGRSWSRCQWESSPCRSIADLKLADR